MTKIKNGDLPKVNIAARTFNYGYSLLLFQMVQQGVTIAENYGLVFAGPTPLKVSITGNARIERPFGTNLTFNGSESFDPDVSDGPGIPIFTFMRLSRASFLKGLKTVEGCGGR